MNEITTAPTADTDTPSIVFVGRDEHNGWARDMSFIVAGQRFYGALTYDAWDGYDWTPDSEDDALPARLYTYEFLSALDDLSSEQQNQDAARRHNRD
jgi:hypothetical protein